MAGEGVCMCSGAGDNDDDDSADGGGGGGGSSDAAGAGDAVGVVTDGFRKSITSSSSLFFPSFAVVFSSLENILPRQRCLLRSLPSSVMMFHSSFSRSKRNSKSKGKGYINVLPICKQARDGEKRKKSEGRIG